jgi:integrase
VRGSIVKRGKTYSYVLYLGRDDQGRKRQKWVGGFRTKREAEGALTEALERRRTGTWGDPGRQTVGEFLTAWLLATKPSLRDTTAASYEATLTGWVVPRIGSIRLATLDAARISALYGELLAGGRRNGKGGLSERSVRYCHAILSHALGDAVRWGLLPRNPVAPVDAPRRQQPEMRVWAAPEVQRFLTHVADDRLYAMWALLISTGMRRGEVCGLQWADIDVQRGTVAIRRARVAIGYDVRISEPKTARGRRVVRIDPVTAAALGVWRKRQIEDRLRAGEIWQDGAWLFTDEVGRPLHPQTLTVSFRRHVKAAGLPSIRLHDLRHTAATLALTAGLHPRVVADRLGHSSTQLTMDTYSHVAEQLQADAGAQVAALIYPPGATTSSS